MKDISVKIVRGLMVLLSRLPLKFHYFMGDILAWFMKNIIRYRRDMVIMNLSRSFPDLKAWKLRRITDEFYRHFGEIFAEAVWFSGSNYKRLHDSGIVTVTNPEVISELFESAPSVTVLSTHCGNWELLGGFLGYRNGDVKYTFDEEQITVVYKELTNPVFSEVFLRNRVNPLERVGTSCEIESRHVLRFTLEHKNEKRVYIYPTDQCPYKGSKKYPIGEFMHQPTVAMLGSAGLACRLSHAVVYLKMKRVERGRYEMTLITIAEDASKYSPEEIMRKYYDLLQEEINETPYNWLWTHNRWKL